jgi:hypothetical protein
MLLVENLSHNCSCQHRHRSQPWNALVPFDNGMLSGGCKYGLGHEFIDAHVWKQDNTNCC